MLGLMILVIAVVSVVGLSAILWEAAGEYPPIKARRAFKKLRISILKCLGPELQAEATSFLDQCERELESLLRAAGNVSHMEDLASSLSASVDPMNSVKFRYPDLLKQIKTRQSDFMEQMLYVHRLTITQDRQGFEALKEIARDLHDSVEARREAFAEMSFDFDKELAEAQKKA